MGAVGKIIGGIVGGPVGAMAGDAAGNALGQSAKLAYSGGQMLAGAINRKKADACLLYTSDAADD